jgi:hypothetical protein
MSPAVRALRSDVVRRAASRGGTLRCAEAHALPTLMSISPTRLVDYTNMAGREATSRQRCCRSRHLFRLAHILLEGAGKPASTTGALARAAVAATVMTAWDVVMDPGMARAGKWTWENGGPYFGVPFQNFIGWIATTLTIYLVVALIFRRVPGRQSQRLHVSIWESPP